MGLPLPEFNAGILKTRTRSSHYKNIMLRRRIFTAALFYALLLPTFALGQSTAPAVYTAPKETIDRMREEGTTRSQVMQTLSYMTDVIGGRLTGSPSMMRANEWTRDKMK